MTEENNTAVFTELEARIVACLMEKQLTTPNNYPLSMNSLLLACNQKTNRVPVMNLTEGQLGHAVSQLEDRKMLGVDYGGRANHVTHRVMTAFNINRKQQAILAVLMVREPLTLNDIKTKTGRMERFDGADEVLQVIESLLDREEPMLLCLPKGPGRREDRYTHVLCGEVDIETVQSQIKEVSVSKSTRIDDLEQRIVQLENKLNELMTLLD